MKKFYILLATLILVFYSCSTTEIQDTDIVYDNSVINYNSTEQSETFVADLEPEELVTIFGFLKRQKKMKSLELNNSYFVPRNNTVELYFTSGADKICIIFTQSERQKIIESATQFLQEHENHSFINHKVNAKTSYIASKCSLWFGITGPNTGCESTRYFTNYEIFEKHAYFVISFIPTECQSTGAYTPNVNLYFTPSQTKILLELLDQDYLLSTIEGKLEQAYQY